MPNPSRRLAATLLSLALLTPTLALAASTTQHIADFMNAPGRLRGALSNISKSSDATYARYLEMAIADVSDDELIRYDAAIMNNTLTPEDQQTMLTYIDSPHGATLKIIFHGEPKDIKSSISALPQDEQKQAIDFISSPGMDKLITAFSTPEEQTREQALADKLVCQELVGKNVALLKKYKAQGKCGG